MLLRVLTQSQCIFSVCYMLHGAGIGELQCSYASVLKLLILYHPYIVTDTLNQPPVSCAFYGTVSFLCHNSQLSQCLPWSLTFLSAFLVI